VLLYSAAAGPNRGEEMRIKPGDRPTTLPLDGKLWTVEMLGW